MLELLGSLWMLITGVLSSLWGLIATVLTFAGDLFYMLHVDMPRLEGLLVGVALAWLMM